jgi:hypothetical protein
VPLSSPHLKAALLSLRSKPLRSYSIPHRETIGDGRLRLFLAFLGPSPLLSLTHATIKIKSGKE